MAIRNIAMACLVATVLVTLGCQNASVNVIQSFPKRPSDYPIYLVEGDVMEPYTLVATIRTEAFEEWEADHQGPESLRRWARRLGGDAVINMQRTPVMVERFGFFPARTYRAGTDVVTAYYYTGTIIRLDRSQIAPPL